MNDSFIAKSAPAGLEAGKRERVLALVEAGAGQFAQLGFARTQMADIARAAGVAVGTPYRYCASKEVFFDLAVRLGFGEDPLEGVSGLPVPERDPGATLAFVRAWFDGRGPFVSLRRAIDGDAPADRDGVEREVRAIVGEIYDEISGHALGIRIVDRSAREWPELAELFFRQLRQLLIELLEMYVASRVGSGAFASTPDAGVLGRIVLETCAWFGMHRRFDVSPPASTDEAVRRTVIESLTRSLMG